jgi:2-isopropylmalate synthase
VILEHGPDGVVVAEATVRVVLADGQRQIATAEGNGPVNALDAALRAALSPTFPWLSDVELSDYKVRILTTGRSESFGTDAVTRVLLESTGPAGSWTTVGVHSNVVEASWLALVDALAYAALRERGPVPVNS